MLLPNTGIHWCCVCFGATALPKRIQIDLFTRKECISFILRAPFYTRTPLSLPEVADSQRSPARVLWQSLEIREYGTVGGHSEKFHMSRAVLVLIG